MRETFMYVPPLYDLIQEFGVLLLISVLAGSDISSGTGLHGEALSFVALSDLAESVYAYIHACYNAVF